MNPKRRSEEFRRRKREEKINRYLRLTEKKKRRLHPCQRNSVFLNHDETKTLPERSGCYAIIRISDNHVYYVGATNCLRKRLSSHLSPSYEPWNKEPKNSCRAFYWLEKDPFSLERDLIRFLAPSANIHYSYELFIEAHQWNKKYRMHGRVT